MGVFFNKQASHNYKVNIEKPDKVKWQKTKGQKAIVANAIRTAFKENEGRLSEEGQEAWKSLSKSKGVTDEITWHPAFIKKASAIADAASRRRKGKLQTWKDKQGKGTQTKSEKSAAKPAAKRKSSGDAGKSWSKAVKKNKDFRKKEGGGKTLNKHIDTRNKSKKGTMAYNTAQNSINRAYGSKKQHGPDHYDAKKLAELLFDKLVG